VGATAHPAAPTIRFHADRVETNAKPACRDSGERAGAAAPIIAAPRSSSGRSSFKTVRRTVLLAAQTTPHGFPTPSRCCVCLPNRTCWGRCTPVRVGGGMR